MVRRTELRIIWRLLLSRWLQSEEDEMGIGSDTIVLLRAMKEKGLLADPPGAVMEIGRQQLANSFLGADIEPELRALGAAYGASGLLELPKPLSTRLAHGSLEQLRWDAPDARPFWEWLGY